jgi:hypothetical protein
MFQNRAPFVILLVSVNFVYMWLMDSRRNQFLIEMAFFFHLQLGLPWHTFFHLSSTDCHRTTTPIIY